MNNEEMYEKIINPRLEKIEDQLTNHIPHMFKWIIGIVLGSWISLVSFIFVAVKFF